METSVCCHGASATGATEGGPLAPAHPCSGNSPATPGCWKFCVTARTILSPCAARASSLAIGTSTARSTSLTARAGGPPPNVHPWSCRCTLSAGGWPGSGATMTNDSAPSSVKSPTPAIVLDRSPVRRCQPELPRVAVTALAPQFSYSMVPSSRGSFGFALFKITERPGVFGLHPNSTPAPCSYAAGGVILPPTAGGELHGDCLAP